MMARPMISGICGTTALPRDRRRSTRCLTPCDTRVTPSHSPLRQSARPQAATNALSASSSDKDCHASIVAPTASQACRTRCRKQDAAAKGLCPPASASACGKSGKATARSLESCSSGCGPCGEARDESFRHRFRKLFSGFPAALATVSIPSRPFKPPSNRGEIPSAIPQTSGSTRHQPDWLIEPRDPPDAVHASSDAMSVSPTDALRGPADCCSAHWRRLARSHPSSRGWSASATSSQTDPATRSCWSRSSMSPSTCCGARCGRWPSASGCCG